MSTTNLGFLYTPNAKFSSRELVATEGMVEAWFANEKQPFGRFVERHFQGDWGDVNEEDAAENELALKEGLRIWSIYHLNDGTKFYIITEADRSVTTLLLPEEY